LGAFLALSPFRRSAKNRAFRSNLLAIAKRISAQSLALLKIRVHADFQL
jgi:hypothetical protein